MSFALGKIQPPQPRRGRLLERPRLEARLREALRTHRVVLVAAPAGCGKTALLVRALVPTPPGSALAWVSLDPGDDLHRLLECLLAALEPHDLPWRVAPEGLLAEASRGDAPGRQRAADALADALDAAEVAHGTIVIDDLHHLDDDAAPQFLQRLVERPGARWTLVLSAREVPPALAPRAAAPGALAQFGEADLRFDADEAQAWFAAQGIDADTARALHARTGGWAAGLQLVLSDGRGAGPGAAIDRTAFDYLATEVLKRLDPALRRFLLDTSVLHELDARRCIALTGDARAARWLDAIERRGLFASVVDEATGTLRLHDLFRDALRHRLRIERPDDWPRLLARAAGLEADPVRRQALLLAAGLADAAARALLDAAPAMNTGGAVGTVLRLLAAYPEAFRAGSAEWQRVAALATLTVWRLGESERHFASAASLYRARGDSAAAQTMDARRASVLVALGRIGDAAAVLDALAAAPPAGFEARLLAANAATWLHLERGEYDAVAPAFEVMLQLLQGRSEVPDWSNVPPPRQTACRGMAALTQRWATGALAAAGDRPTPLGTFALLSLAWRALWLGRAGESRALLEQALGDAAWGGHEVIARSHALALQAVLALLRGDAADAVRTVRRRIDEQPAGYAGWGVWHVLHYAARVAAAAGDDAALRDWLQRLNALHDTLSDATPQRLLPVAALRGMLALHQGDRAGASAHFQQVLDDEAHADLLGLAGEVRVRLARLRLAGGDRDAAAALIAPLLERVDDGPRGAVFAAADLAALSREDWAGRLGAAAQATLRGWADALMHPATEDPAEARAADGAVAPTGERLSARELEVLARLARGDSNKVIARALDLSPHTVKRHVANVLGKLGVASRGQAAAWYHGHAAARD